MAEEGSSEESESNEPDKDSGEEDSEEGDSEESKEQDKGKKEQKGHHTKEPSDEELEAWEKEYGQVSPTLRGRQAKKEENHLLDMLKGSAKEKTNIKKMYSEEKRPDYHNSNVAGLGTTIELRDGDEEDLSDRVKELAQNGTPLTIFVPKNMLKGYRYGWKVLQRLRGDIGDKKTKDVRIYMTDNTDERNLVVVYDDGENKFVYRPASVTELVQRISPAEDLGKIAREQVIEHMTNITNDAMFYGQ